MVQILGEDMWGCLCVLLNRFVCKQPGKVMNGLVGELLCVCVWLMGGGGEVYMCVCV